MGESQDELDPQKWKSSFSQTTEEVAKAVVAAAAAVRPRPSIVFSSNSPNSHSNRTLERLQRQITRVWKQGFSKDNTRRGFFNPEHLTSQKRQWTQLQMQMLERKKWVEPTNLFEHMVVVGIHPEAETQALEAALLKRRNWERELDAPERLRDVMRQQFRGTTPPVPDPEILFAFPPGKRLPMRQKDLLSFCFPGGVEAHLVERTPSLSELNELVYGQDHVTRDDLSYTFLLKVADNATLYGVCIYVPELVKQPPGIMNIGASSEKNILPTRLSRFSLTTYRCYCLLTKLPFFDLHFDVLNSIITQERLDRITECVNEMAVGPSENGGDGIYTQNTDDSESNPNLSLPGEVSPVDSCPEKSSGPIEELPSESGTSNCHNPGTTSDDDINGVHGTEMEGENDTITAAAHSNGECLRENQEIKSPLSKNAEEVESSPSMEARLRRADSLDSVSSFRYSVNSEDDDEVSSSGQEYNNSQLELMWPEIDNCLLKILYGYYKLPVPARGSSLSFHPLEHLPYLTFTRRANETSTLLGGRTIDMNHCKSILEVVEVQNALAAAEEAAAIAHWTVATVCRVLSLENVLALFAAALLEKQVVVVCPNQGVLSAIVLSTIPLIRPFQWQSLILPILPNQMLDFLDAPVPYIVGVLHKSSALRSKSSSVMIVNVQRDKVTMPYTPALPHRKELSSALQPYHARLAAEADFAKKHPVHVCNEAQSDAAESFLAVLRSYLESLCANLRAHTITNVQSNNDKVSLLLKDSFVEDFESKDHPFMKLFVDTQLFSMHTDAVLSFIESN